MLTKQQQKVIEDPFFFFYADDSERTLAALPEVWGSISNSDMAAQSHLYPKSKRTQCSLLASAGIGHAYDLLIIHIRSGKTANT